MMIEDRERERLIAFAIDAFDAAFEKKKSDPLENKVHTQMGQCFDLGWAAVLHS
jgi:hypothetical protein